MAQWQSLALQLGGSLVAVLFLAGMSRWLQLGGDLRIRTEGDARRLADEAICGFDPVDLALDRAGIGALLRDGAGRVLLIRRHGGRFAARLLDSHAGVRLDRNFLTVETSDPHFGAVTLDLGPRAPQWAGSFRRLAV